MSDTDIDLDDELLIDFEAQVDLVRIMDNLMLPVTLDLHAAVLTSAGNVPMQDADVQVAFAKIRFWLDNVMARAVVFAADNETALAMLFDGAARARCANPVMLAPEAPSDEHLAVLLQAKLTALAAGAISFGAMRVQSSASNGVSYTFLGNAREVLPSAPAWLGERNYFTEPWWWRDDASTFDTKPPADADLSQVPAWAYKLDFIEQVVRPPSSPVVLKPGFRPRVIDGGRTDLAPEA